MIKIMLLGKNGQVGWELQRTLDPLGEVVALSRKELDLEEEKAIRDRVREIKPAIIVNAAAYSAVDQAEVEPEKAWRVNSVAPGVLAQEAKRLNALLVHYSTDYVFDGKKDGPYMEEDKARPINVYGETKLKGEYNIQEAGAAYLILRTSWVYGLRGKNFLLTMQCLAKEKDELRVVDDQLGSPTWCRMIAEATALILSQGKYRVDNYTGIYHLCAGGETSWHGFARAIFDYIFSNEDKYARLIPIPTSEFKTLAVRPANSVLSCSKLNAIHGITLPRWNYSLKRALEISE